MRWPWGEENTKASLIEPMLEALGWDIRDPEEVHREYKSRPKDKPVDYALKLFRKLSLFIEAKSIGGNLTDRKWVSQVLSYATVAGVEWCVLTDGDEYRLYNATAPVDAEEKLFLKVRISEDDTATAVHMLSLISRENLEGNLLDVLWNSHFVDRRVKAALRTMFDKADKGLVRLVRRRIPNLKPKDIAESIQRLDVQIESPGAPTESTGPGVSPGKKKVAVGKKELPPPRKAPGRASIKDMIDAGLLNPPVRLFRLYRSKKYQGKDAKKQELKAIIRADGTIEFAGTIYSTASKAAEQARESVAGTRLNTNGWTFWKVMGSNGKPVPLDSIRKAYLKTSKG